MHSSTIDYYDGSLDMSCEDLFVLLLTVSVFLVEHTFAHSLFMMYS